MTSLFFIFK